MTLSWPLGAVRHLRLKAIYDTRWAELKAAGTLAG